LVATSQPIDDVRTREHSLIRRAQQGDRAAFAGLVDAYWDRLYRWLYHLARNQHTAEDLTQETFLKAFANLTRFRAESNFAGWLFRIGHNNFANHYRGSRPREAMPDDLPTPHEGPVEECVLRETQQGLADALERLPTDFRAALLLRVEEGLSFREIAKVLSLTEETARWRVFKARQKLLSLMSPRGEGDPS
jgi:RNA polymerase sigma-70 factor, ECF subfamily